MWQNLSSLQEKVRSAVEQYFGRVVEAFPSQVDSCYLYGSVVTSDFQLGRSDINSLVLFETFMHAEMERMRPIVQSGLKEKIVAPLCLSVSTFERSADTFPLEFIEIQDKHLQLYGERNRVQALEIKPEDLRLKLEEQIKGKLIRLREIFMESGDQPKLLLKVLSTAQRDLYPVFRNLLRLKTGQVPPVVKEAVLNELEVQANVSTASCQQIWSHIHQNQKIDLKGVSSLYGEYVDLLTKLSTLIDSMEKSGGGPHEGSNAQS